MGTLIDSSVLIAAERGHLDLEKAIADRKDEQLRLAAITVAELYEGVERADTAERAEKRRSLIEGYLARIPVVDFDATIAREYARMRARLLPVGQTIAVHDLQMAVTAIVLGFQVATRDMRSFPRIQTSDSNGGERERTNSTQQRRLSLVAARAVTTGSWRFVDVQHAERVGFHVPSALLRQQRAHGHG